MENIDLKSLPTRNERRAIIQSRILEIWKENNCFGSFIVSVGVGKTKIIADAIKEIGPLIDKEKYDVPILIGTSSSILRDVGTPAELKKWGCTEEVEIQCYQTLYKWKDKKIGLVILDEQDFSCSEKYSDFYRNNTFDKFLGLTGTFEDSKKKLVEHLQSKDPGNFGPLLYEYPIEQAQADGIVNNINIVVHEVPLSTDKTIKVTYTKNGVEKSFMQSERDKYIYINNRILAARIELSKLFTARDNTKDSVVKEKLNKKIGTALRNKEWWESGKGNSNSRATFLYSLDSLTKYTLRLKKRLLRKPENKIILFARFIKDIDKITPYGYYGDKDDDVINRFNNSEIRELGVSKKANRGVSFVGLNQCIAHSYSSSDTEFIQGLQGRLTRLDIDKNPGAEATLHILVSYYYDNNGKKKYCQNMKWAESFLKDIEYETIKNES